MLPPLLPPSATHLHCSQGLMTYDDIFDGKFTPMLAAGGGNITTHHQGIIFHHPSTGLRPWLRHIPLHNGEIPAAFCTRHLFETCTRKLVMENPKIQFQYGVVVSGLQIGWQEPGGDEAAKHVTGRVLTVNRQYTFLLTCQCCCCHSSQCTGSGYSQTTPAALWALSGRVGDTVCHRILDMLLTCSGHSTAQHSMVPHVVHLQVCIRPTDGSVLPGCCLASDMVLMSGVFALTAGVCLSDGSVLAADLVVDCSGRGSSLPSWLAAAGCPRPRTTRATVDGGYAAW